MAEEVKQESRKTGPELNVETHIAGNLQMAGESIMLHTGLVIYVLVPGEGVEKFKFDPDTQGGHLFCFAGKFTTPNTFRYTSGEDMK